MRFARVRFGDPEVAPLLAGILQEYEVRYGPGDETDDTEASQFDPPDGVFLVLLDERAEPGGANAERTSIAPGGPVTVAGGGIRRFDENTAEVKRMWTSPDHRRQGHAISVLAELESIARELGYHRLRLETGHAQPEALALYRRLGFREIGNYGHYPHATGFERTLVADLE